MARPKNDTPPPSYGRQAKGKTIKSLSIETDVLRKAEEEAAKRGMSFSAYINALLKGTLLIAVLAHLFRSPADWSASALEITAKAGLAMIAELL